MCCTGVWTWIAFCCALFGFARTLSLWQIRMTELSIALQTYRLPLSTRRTYPRLWTVSFPPWTHVLWIPASSPAGINIDPSGQLALKEVSTQNTQHRKRADRIISRIQIIDTIIPLLRCTGIEPWIPHRCRSPTQPSPGSEIYRELTHRQWPREFHCSIHLGVKGHNIVKRGGRGRR